MCITDNLYVSLVLGKGKHFPFRCNLAPTAFVLSQCFFRSHADDKRELTKYEYEDRKLTSAVSYITLSSHLQKAWDE